MTCTSYPHEDASQRHEDEALTQLADRQKRKMMRAGDGLSPHPQTIVCFLHSVIMTILQQITADHHQQMQQRRPEPPYQIVPIPAALCFFSVFLDVARWGKPLLVTLKPFSMWQGEVQSPCHVKTFSSTWQGGVPPPCHVEAVFDASRWGGPLFLALNLFFDVLRFGKPLHVETFFKWGTSPYRVEPFFRWIGLYINHNYNSLI